MPTLVGKRKVKFSRDEVDTFRSAWPAGNLRSRSYWFEFDAIGDLVDTDVPHHDDGADALALSQDAQKWLEGQKP